LSLTNHGTAFPWYQETFSLFNALIDKGHSILVIEHNLDLIKCADWIIGVLKVAKRGQLLVNYEQIMKIKSITGHYLKDKL
jgi:excinuclease ABC subunit A